MTTYTYRFTGTSPEEFPYLPADPPARLMEPGDTVDCSEKVEHARLELVPKTAKPTPSTPTAAAAPASPKTEA
jgi:hypothetical protein